MVGRERQEAKVPLTVMPLSDSSRKPSWAAGLCGIGDQWLHILAIVIVLGFFKERDPKRETPFSLLSHTRKTYV